MCVCVGGAPHIPLHACTHIIHRHTDTNTHTHAQKPAWPQTHTVPTQTHTHTRTHITHTHARMHARTYIHGHIRIKTRPPALSSINLVTTYGSKRARAKKIFFKKKYRPPGVSSIKLVTRCGFKSFRARATRLSPYVCSRAFCS